MRRRDVIAGLVVAATTGRARAEQPTKVHRLAVIATTGDIAEWTEGLAVFFGELRRLGYVEGQNLLVERYSGEGRVEHYPEMAREVVRHSPDLIYVRGGGDALFPILKAATATIPIVGVSSDPVALGVAVSLARPGNNITGVTIDVGTGIMSKRLEILSEAVPGMSKVALLASRGAWEIPSVPAMRRAAQRMGVSLVGPPLDSPLQEAEYRRVFMAMAQQGRRGALRIGRVCEPREPGVDR
jgi:putative tryptophan/tyrosine transport system substrate-binding protein